MLRLFYLRRRRITGLCKGTRPAGFVLVLALVVLSLMFAAAAGLSLARQFWGFSSSKQVDRVLMEASIAADMALWFTVFRSQVQDAATSATTLTPNTPRGGVDFAPPGVQSAVEASLQNAGLSWPSRALTVVGSMNSTASELFTPPSGVNYPEFPPGVGTWSFDLFFRLEAAPAVISGGSLQDLSGSIPFPMASRDPFFGTYSRVHGMPLLFRREMNDSQYGERVGRYGEDTTKLRAWYSIDGAGNMGAGLRSFPLSQFTLFSAQPSPTLQASGGRLAGDPLVLSSFDNGVGLNLSAFQVGGDLWAKPGALFYGVPDIYSYSYQDDVNPTEVAYPASQLGIGRVYVEGYAEVRGGLQGGTEAPLPLGMPLVVTGDGWLPGWKRGYGGLFDDKGVPIGRPANLAPSPPKTASPPSFMNLYDGGSSVFSFANFAEYVQWVGMRSGFMLSSSSVTACRLIRMFGSKETGLGGSVWVNKPLEGYIEEVWKNWIPFQLGLSGNGTTASPFSLVILGDPGTSGFQTAVKAAWQVDYTPDNPEAPRVLRFTPGPGYYDQFGPNLPARLGQPPLHPLVVYIGRAWKDAGFKVELDVDSVKGMATWEPANGDLIPREGLDRLTVVSVPDVYLLGDFNGGGLDAGTMVVAPRIHVDPDISEISGIFVTEGPSPLHAFRTKADMGWQDVFKLKGGLFLWNRNGDTASGWVSGKPYLFGESVLASGLVYLCQVPHVSSGSFSGDLAAGRWAEQVFKPVGLEADAGYISGNKMPWSGAGLKDAGGPNEEYVWLGPPVVMDARPYLETLELYKVKAAKDSTGGFREYRQENRKD